MVTLSGLRGYMERGETLVFRSSLHPSTKHFHDITVLSTRSNSFASLPPLPNHLALSSPSPYPTFTITAQTNSVPLPRARHCRSPRSPSPPKPCQRPASVSRLSNPFASLFGHKQPPSPNPSTAPTTSQTSPTSSDAADHVCEITAFAINRKIVSKDIGREINRALRAEIKESLAGLPTVEVQREQEAVQDHGNGVAWVPGAVASRVFVFGADNKSDTGVAGGFVGEISGFLRVGRRGLERRSTPFLSRKRDDQPPGEEVVTQKIDSDAKIAEIMETVERTICSLFYDRSVGRFQL
ncbi:Vacuolar protein sorting-associated protein [Salix suchowensis]|nr:Vacuolar protein sorting-associated protein [Salix suchowensis]